MFIKRSSWSKRDPNHIIPHPVTSTGGAVELVVIHHAVTGDDFVRALQQVEAMHLDDGYYDFAYNGAASNTTDEYTDGRGPVTQGGATGNGIDRQSLSIVAVGQFHSKAPHVTPPTDELVENIASLIARWINDGHVSKTYQIAPHNHYYPTACCGDLLEPLLPEIRKRSLELLDNSRPITDLDIMSTPLEDWRKLFNAQKVAPPKDNSYNAIVEMVQRWLGGHDLYQKTHGMRTWSMSRAIQEYKRVHYGQTNPGIGIGAQLWGQILEDTGLVESS